MHKDENLVGAGNGLDRENSRPSIKVYSEAGAQVARAFLDAFHPPARPKNEGGDSADATDG